MMNECKECIMNAENRCKLHLDYEHQMHHGPVSHDVFIVECNEKCRAKERAKMERQSCYLCNIPLKNDDADENGVSDVRLTKDGNVLLAMCFVCFAESFKYTFHTMLKDFAKNGVPQEISNQKKAFNEKPESKE